MRIEDSIFRIGKKTQHHVPDEQRIARGKEARRSVRRSTQRELDMRGRPDPIAFLEEQARTRVPELVPIRHGRMMASSFAFFRGAALVMASDEGSRERQCARAR